MIFEPDPSSSELPSQKAGASSAPGNRPGKRKQTALDRLPARFSGHEADAAEFRFIFVRWPSGSWTIALDRDYNSQDIEYF